MLAENVPADGQQGRRPGGRELGQAKKADRPRGVNQADGRDKKN